MRRTVAGSRARDWVAGFLSTDSSSPPFFGYALLGLLFSALNDLVAVLNLSARGQGMIGQAFTHPSLNTPTLVVFHVIEGYIVLPAIWAFFVWVRRAPRVLQQQLGAGGVVSMHAEARLNEFPGFGRAVWIAIYVSGIMLALSGTAYSLYHPPGWNDASRALAQSRLPMTAILWFMLWVILFSVLDAAFALHKIFGRGALRLRPFHPDRVCGLGALKRYAQTLVDFLAAAIGIGVLLDAVQALLTGTFLADRILQVYLVAYVVLVPACFLGSLWSGHLAMVRERDRILESSVPVSFDAPQTKTLSYTGDLSHARVHVDNVEVVQKFYDIVMGFPVWPFDSGNVRRVAAAALGPVTPAIVSIGVTVVSRLLHLPPAH